ncbi:hypothetical protein Y032_0030g2136 [Ancylostoma ceylanicum]|uniref:Uncharacterized protein n=1 Tax=Ancylostoma ceylanicum TaxID=53326 RepID=A0A016URM7_9BILA|nr:hypothetical protein Y032_0030g2136 [Ancylostoma ceylanicum]
MTEKFTVHRFPWKCRIQGCPYNYETHCIYRESGHEDASGDYCQCAATEVPPFLSRIIKRSPFRNLIFLEGVAQVLAPKVHMKFFPRSQI